MAAQHVSQLVELFGKIFSIDSEDAILELEEDGMNLAQELMESSDDPIDWDDVEDDVNLRLKQGLLKSISERPRLASKANQLFQHIDEQEQSGINSYTYLGSENPIEDDMIAVIHESRSIWANLPHNLVRENWDLVRKAAVKYQIPSKIDPELEFDDLISVGREALFSAAQKMWDQPRENFRKFAMQILKERIKNHQSQKHPVPFKTRKKLEKLKSARESLQGKDGAITPETLSKATGFKAEEMESLLEVEAVWGGGFEIDLSDQLEELEIPDLSPSALDLIIDQETTMLMSHALTNLTDMQRSVILSLYFKDQSFRETAKELGISLGVVKKHHRKAMDRLKGVLDAD